MGSPEFVKAGMVKPGAVVIDVGVSRVPDPAAKGGTRLVGDVDFKACNPSRAKSPPTPAASAP